MLNRILIVVILVPLAVALVTLSVANRGLVPVTLDPVNPGNPALTLALPLFVWLFAALGLGILVGSAATWLRQGFYRRMARRNGRAADELRREVRAARPPVEAPAPTVAGRLPALPKPGR